MITKFNCPFCLFGCNQKSECNYILFHKKAKNKQSHPMIKGKKVSLENALCELKNILEKADGIHVDGLSCDYEGIRSIFELCEKKFTSVDHSDGKKNAEINFCLQRYGGYLSSYGEMYKRSDLIFFLGNNNEIFYEIINKKRKKKVTQFIFFDNGISKFSDVHFQKFKKNRLSDDFSLLSSLLCKQNYSSNKKFKKTIDLILNSKHGTIVYLPMDDDLLTQNIFKLTQFLNKEKKRFSLLPLNRGNNLSGAVQYSLWKTGYPLRVQFTNSGPIYDPVNFSSQNLSKVKELQIFFSSFEYEKKPLMFKKNIFIGNPNQINKKSFDVFIPTKIPGINNSGIIFNRDGVGIRKLSKIYDNSDYSTQEIIRRII